MPTGQSGADAGRTLVALLAGESIEALAVRLAELVGDAGAGERFIDASEVARRHGVSRAFVYEHADELGAVRLGSGPRPRLRFDPAAIADRLVAICVSPTPPTEPPRARRRKPAAKTGSDAKLLPIRHSGRAEGDVKRT